MRHNVAMTLDAQPGGRLITQQLLYSALLTQHPRIALTAVEITDLASLIDVYCLFDAAHVLGRAWNVLDTEGSGSELGAMLSEYVIVDEVDTATTENLRRVAQAHQSTVVAALQGDRGAQSAYEDDLFDERGFIYLAYADLQRLPFTPDVQRAEQIRQLARAEDTFAGELLPTCGVSIRNAPDDGPATSRVAFRHWLGWSSIVQREISAVSPVR